MMVVAVGFRIEAADLNAAAAIAGKGKKLTGGGNLQDPPPAALEHRIWRALVPDLGGASL